MHAQPPLRIRASWYTYASKHVSYELCIMHMHAINDHMREPR